MGRTAPTYRQALEERLKRWELFGRLLTTPEEQSAFATLVKSARRHIPQATYWGSPDLLEALLLSILLDLTARLPGSNGGPGPRS